MKTKMTHEKNMINQMKTNMTIERNDEPNEHQNDTWKTKNMMKQMNTETSQNEKHKRMKIAIVERTILFYCTLFVFVLFLLFIYFCLFYLFFVCFG